MSDSSQGVTFSERGFGQYGEFTDTKGSKVYVAESSSIDGGIWIFCKNDNGFEDPSPHMNGTQTRKLIAMLEAALARQTFNESDEDEES